jgi:hypothetical protein
MTPAKTASLQVKMAVFAIGGLGAAALIAMATRQVIAEPVPAKPERRACIDVSTNLNRQVIGKNKLRLEDGLGRSAILTLSAPCSNMDDFDKIGFELSGSSQLCDVHDMKILFSRHGEAPLTCLITDLKVFKRGQTEESQSSSSSSSL